MKRDVEFLKLDIDLGGKQYHQDLTDDLRINSDDINQSYIDQPSKYAWWAVLAAQARGRADKLKNAADKQDEFIRKVLTGKLDELVRQDLEMNGEKVTEGKVSNGICKHSDYIAALEDYHNLKDQYVQANEDASILEAARDSLNQRKEMLISLGAQLRVDLSNVELSMKKKEVADIISKSKSSKSK